MELSYAKLYFTFTLTADVADPYALFGCRADFDAAFKRVASCRRPDCAGCLTTGSCSYPRNFGQKIAKDPEAVKRHQKPPLPFVFDLPLLPPAPNRGATLELGLTLFGSALHDASRFMEGVTLLLRGFSAELVRVEAEAPGGERAPVVPAQHPPLPLLGALDPAQPGPLAPDSLSIRLITPLRLIRDGHLLKSFTFGEFIRPLMRRVSSLAYYYEGSEPDVDYHWLSTCSAAVRTVASECRFVTCNGRPAGVAGRVRFAGDLEPFHLFLQLGCATHLGKGASFGFGAYRIES